VPRALKVLHIITGLDGGGAEMMLLKLLAQFRDDGEPEGEVLCLAGGGPVQAPIAALNVSVTNLGMSPGLGAFLKCPRLKGAIAAAEPDIVQTWMYHANLMVGLALGWRSGPPLANLPLVWGLRQSNLDRTRSKKRTILVAHAGAWMSRRVVNRIVCVSGNVRDVHVAMGYDAGKLMVIPNGFDLDHFWPDLGARAELRVELRIDENTPLVGLVARFDPQKDHGTFIRAARLVCDNCPDTVFVLCGEGIERTNEVLIHMIRRAGLEKNVRLLGRRDDIARITASLDIAVSSSAFGEGFSNAIGEALCCGVPVVATDVGESRLIVGDAGITVLPGNATALGVAIGELIAMEPDARRRLGALGRECMAREYSIAAIASRYRELYRKILSPKAGQP
jgi:glycosyltransferase involved in cell wall biosynthesis